MAGHECSGMPVSQTVQKTRAPTNRANLHDNDFPNALVCVRGSGLIEPITASLPNNVTLPGSALRQPQSCLGSGRFTLPPAGPLGDLLECGPVAVQRCFPAREALPPGDHYVHVLGVQFNAPANPFSDLRGGQGCTRSEEGFVASLPTLCVIQQRTPHQIYRFLSWVIILLLVGAPIMNFGEGESHTVEFSPALPNHAAFFFRTYQHGSCWYQ